MEVKELVKVQVNEKQEAVVSGRELHKFLELDTRYNDWIKRMLNYGFVENTDFITSTQKRVTAQGNATTYVDHIMKLDMAKELSMIQRTDRGKQARQYFIQVDKDFNSPEKVMARALIYANNKMGQLEAKIREDKPKVLFATSVEGSENSCLIGELAKLISQNGYDIGQNRLFSWMRENGYLIKRRGESYNSPTQYSMDLGLMEVKKRAINNPDGSVRTTSTTKVTGKGQIYFVNKFVAGRE